MSGSDELRFYLVDVFTQERFGGNPLAVVPDADAVDEKTMRQIARELNQSERRSCCGPPMRARPIGFAPRGWGASAQIACRPL